MAHRLHFKSSESINQSVKYERCFVKNKLLTLCFSVVLTASAFMTKTVWAQGAGGSDSFADYSFGGACTSQGQWTQVALEATHRIAQVVSKLRDNANCNGLRDTMKNLLGQADQQLSGMNDKGGP